MSDEPNQPSWWEQLSARTASIGVGGVIKMMARKSIRPILRTRQRWRLCRAERAWRTTARVRPSESTDLLAEVFRRKLRTALPVGPDRAIAIKDLFERHALDEKTRIFEAADRVCDHVFDLLGSGPVKLGPVIDWHTDFKSGYRWNPNLPYYNVRYGDVPGVDVKVPWELSRGQHLPLLAQATWLSGDDRYVNELVAHIEHWIGNNPVGRGVNWACPMDVAIRAVNWLWAVSLSADSPLVSPSFLTRLAASLMQHGRHVYGNLERRDDGITTNHYVADVVGLLYLGLCLPESPETDRWRRFAVRSLIEEMDVQVLPDGVHYESSISYHRLVTEMFLSSAALCRHHGQELPRTFWSRLERMCEFVDAYTKPNGLAPQIGDGDNGRLHILSGYGTDPRDHRHVLALGSVLFGRDEWLGQAGPAWVEALWFGGGSHPHSQPPEDDQALVFPQGGLCVLKKSRDYVLMNCSPVGTKGLGTHKHNDALAIEVHMKGNDLIVDPGCFLYTADPSVYHAFRMTTVHPTVVIDGLEQNRDIEGKLFAMHPDSQPVVVDVPTRTGAACMTAELRGLGAARSVTHRRTVTLDRESQRLVITDFFSSAFEPDEHRLDWTFPFAPGLSLTPGSREDEWTIDGAVGRWKFHVIYGDSGTLPNRLRYSLHEEWVSLGYGVRQQATCLRMATARLLPCTVEFELSGVTLSSATGS